MGERAAGLSGLMLFRMIECLRNGLPLDQNVYEGCFWSSVGPLSEKSLAQGGMPQEFPDFTRGNWKTTRPLGIVTGEGPTPSGRPPCGAPEQEGGP